MNSNKIYQVVYSKIGESKNQKRIWLEGGRLTLCGFTKGAKYLSFFNTKEKKLTLILDKNGNKTVSGKKVRNKDEFNPIIDICNSAIFKTFGDAVKIKISFSQGKVVISLHHEEAMRNNRESRLMKNILNSTLVEASICTGIGISTHAIKTGLSESGFRSSLAWVCDSEKKYLDIADKNNEALTDDTKILVGSIEEVEGEELDKVDILSASLPCTGHSKAGKTKNKISKAEDHKDASTSVFGFINAVKCCEPSIIISENVPEARNSATYSLIKSELRRLGYEIHEKELGKKEGACIENRNRYWFVAVSRGLINFNLNDLPNFERSFNNVGDVLEANKESLFFDKEVFTRREVKNVKAGRGFKSQYITKECTSMGVIPRNYAKRQVSNPHFKGEGDNVRLFTPTEHARIKEIPEHLIHDVSFTTAHEGLGQSILYNHARSIARRIGDFLQELKNNKGCTI